MASNFWEKQLPGAPGVAKFLDRLAPTGDVANPPGQDPRYNAGGVPAYSGNGAASGAAPVGSPSAVPPGVDPAVFSQAVKEDAIGRAGGYKNFTQPPSAPNYAQYAASQVAPGVDNPVVSPNTGNVAYPAAYKMGNKFATPYNMSFSNYAGGGAPNPSAPDTAAIQAGNTRLQAEQAQRTGQAYDIARSVVDKYQIPEGYPNRNYLVGGGIANQAEQSLTVPSARPNGYFDNSGDDRNARVTAYSNEISNRLMAAPGRKTRAELGYDANMAKEAGDTQRQQMVNENYLQREQMGNQSAEKIAEGTQGNQSKQLDLAERQFSYSQRKDASDAERQTGLEMYRMALQKYGYDSAERGKEYAVDNKKTGASGESIEDKKSLETHKAAIAKIIENYDPESGLSITDYIDKAMKSSQGASAVPAQGGSDLGGFQQVGTYPNGVAKYAGPDGRVVLVKDGKTYDEQGNPLR